MEFSQEHITEIGLSEEQVTKVQEITNDHEATLKQGWDGKANTDAEAIINGASTSVAERFGITEARQQGEKIADYLGRISPMVIDTQLSSEKANLETKMSELEEKLKKGNNEALQGQYDDLKGKYDILQEKEAKFADYEENDYKGLYETLKGDMSKQNIETAYASVKPAFPDTVNSYEAKGRWNEFVANTNKTHDIEKGEDGEYVAVDKENKHKVVKLSELVSKDAALQALTQGRQQKGIGSQQSQGNEAVEGIPFKVNKEMSDSDVRDSIRKHLTEDKKLNKTSSEYSKAFAENWSAWKKYKQ